MPKTVLITGATGFIGANLVRKALFKNHNVHIFVRKGYKEWRIADIASQISIHCLNLEERETVEGKLKEIKPDYIFHTAVHGAYASQTNLMEMVHTNIIGTMQLLEAAMKVGFEAFVNTGSSSEYGYKDHAPTEKEWIDPNSYYALTKAAGTQFARYSGQQNKLPIYTLRLYSAYGPYEEPTRLIPMLIAHALKGGLPPLVDPSTPRDYVYVEDIVRAYFLVAEKKSPEWGAVYNVGTEKQTLLSELVEIMKQLTKITKVPVWGSMQQRSWDTSTWISNSKALRGLGWEPKYTIEQGLKKSIEWFKEHPKYLPKI